MKIQFIPVGVGYHVTGLQWAGPAGWMDVPPKVYSGPEFYAAVEAQREGRPSVMEYWEVLNAGDRPGSRRARLMVTRWAGGGPQNMPIPLAVPTGDPARPDYVVTWGPGRLPSVVKARLDPQAGPLRSVSTLPGAPTLHGIGNYFYGD